MVDAFLQRLAHLLIRHSLRARRGERIAIHGGSTPFREALQREIEAAQASPIAVAQSPVSADAWVFVESADPEPNLWPGSVGQTRYVVTFEPAGTHADAIARACFLDRPDPAAAWRQQHEIQEQLCERLSRVDELHVRTAQGTDLRISVAGRRWINCAGGANMPDGEVFTTPAEGRIEGTAVVTLPGVYFEGDAALLSLHFRQGRIVSIESDRRSRLADNWRALEAKRVAEIGFGCNPAIDRFIGHPLFDEKRPGTFHIGLGMGHALRIHTRAVPPHIDLIGELGRDGGVWGDGALLVSGKRQKPVSLQSASFIVYR